MAEAISYVSLIAGTEFDPGPFDVKFVMAEVTLE
jgi:hypothetical protein